MYTAAVQNVTHYSNSMFSFIVSRPQSLKFKSGEFVMIGLDDVFRAYSIVSPAWVDYLEFLSIKVPDGPLTSKLQHIQPGDEIKIKPKATGSLCVDYLTPKTNLILLATGTGLAPFMSIVRDPDTYDRFDNVYLFHTVRQRAELAYKDLLTDLSRSEIGDFVNGINNRFKYVNTVTQETHNREGRFWSYLHLEFPYGLHKDVDAVMVCGSKELNANVRNLLSDWQEGNTGEMGDFVVERAFVG